MNRKQSTNKPRINLAKLHELKSLLRKHELNTVCENAKCPNINDCFNKKRATFLIMGNICTRNCKFCNIGKTIQKPIKLDPNEPLNIANASKKMLLKHVVITSVTRDDLKDEGANHFAKTINELKKQMPQSTIEVLCPDFNNKKALLDIVINAKPDIFNHNLETVERLTPNIRDKAKYKQSLNVLKYIYEQKLITKSGIMLGLGETLEEIEKTIQDLKDVGVKIITIGQYYAPSNKHYPVKKLYTKDEFKEIELIGKKIGINYIYSNANVRSSYMAEEAFTALSKN